jgi:hypothetical protein
VPSLSLEIPSSGSLIIGRSSHKGIPYDQNLSSRHLEVRCDEHGRVICNQLGKNPSLIDNELLKLFNKAHAKEGEVTVYLKLHELIPSSDCRIASKWKVSLPSCCQEELGIFSH